MCIRDSLYRGQNSVFRDPQQGEHPEHGVSAGFRPQLSAAHAVRYLCSQGGWGRGAVSYTHLDSECTTSRAKLRLRLPVRRVAETNMLEDEIAELPLRDGVVERVVKPFEIVTVKLFF